jgi:hypothetical protein
MNFEMERRGISVHALDISDRVGIFVWQQIVPYGPDAPR